MSCPHCAEGFVLPGEPKGSIRPDFLNAYLAQGPAKSSSEASSSKRAVVLLSDVYGLALQNCKIIADRLAEKLDCDVWVPDYFDGRPLFNLDAMTLPDRTDDRMTLWRWLRFYWKNILWNLPAYWSSRESVVDQRVTSFVTLLEEKKAYKKVGAVGYCFGGSALVRHCSTDLFDGAVVCHPGPTKISQLQAIRIPTSWVCAEVDEFFLDKRRNEAEAEFAGRVGTNRFVEYEFKVYKGTTHGFACRPSLKYPEIFESYNQALDQTVAWFEKTLVI